MRKFWEGVPTDDGCTRARLESVQSDREIRDLIARFGDRVVHVTDTEGLHGIRESGEIQPNDGSRKASYANAKNSYSTKSGSVAVFNFAVATNEQMVLVWSQYAHFFVDKYPVTFVLRLDPEGLNLKDHATILAEAGVGGPMKIPYVENLHHGPISAKQIQDVAVVRADPRIEFRIISLEDRILNLDSRGIVNALWPDLPYPRTGDEIWDANISGGINNLTPEERERLFGGIGQDLLEDE